jgi:ABC-type branched-subunit amino acid transport system ATPase component
MDVVRELSDRIIVLHNGQLVADGEPAAVIASPVVQQAYLGMAAEEPHEQRALLELQGVHTHIGAYHILHGVDLSVPEGEVTMLLGRNGAGKTTTLRTIMGLWPPQGSIRFRASHRRPATPDIAQRASPTCPRAWASSPT